MEDDQKREYELALLIDDQSAEAVIDQFLAKLPDGAEIEISKKEAARTIRLAYPVKKFNTATLLVYKFLAIPDVISKIEEGLRFQKNVLRSLLVTLPAQKEEVVKKERVAVAAPQEGVKSETVEATVATKPKQTQSTNPEISSNELLTKTLEELGE